MSVLSDWPCPDCGQDLRTLALAFAALYDATRFERETTPAERRARDTARRVLGERRKG